MALIFITGCARSGTSLTTQMLQAHGCYLGNPERVNGLYENLDIREKVIKPYLRSIGADPLVQKPLPKWPLKPFPELKAEILRYMGGNPPEPWAYKCAKLAVLWPLWAVAFPEAKYVIVRRDKEAIVASCLRTPFMRAYDTPEGWRWWAEQHEARFAEMQGALDCIEIWTDQVIADPDAFGPVAAFCGLEFNRDAVEKAIDRNKWHPV